MSEPRELHDIESDFLLHIGTVGSFMDMLTELTANESRLDALDPSTIVNASISGSHAAQQVKDAFYELMERCNALKEAQS